MAECWREIASQTAKNVEKALAELLQLQASGSLRTIYVADREADVARRKPGDPDRLFKAVCMSHVLGFCWFLVVAGSLLAALAQCLGGAEPLYF